MKTLLTDKEIKQALESVSPCLEDQDILYSRAIEQKILERIGEPVAYIPDDAMTQLAPPRIRLLAVPLITYNGENHTPLYAIDFKEEI